MLQRMGRDQYKTPEGDLSMEFNRVCQLFQLAQGEPSDRLLFDALMGEASDQGLNWIEGLEYVVEHMPRARRPQLCESVLGKRPVSSVGANLRIVGELRKAG